MRIFPGVEWMWTSAVSALVFRAMSGRDAPVLISEWASKDTAPAWAYLAAAEMIPDMALVLAFGR